MIHYTHKIRFLRNIKDCFLGISATAVQRGGLTALTLMALLLNRNTFNDPADPEAGLAGFAFAITIAGIGITIGAIVAPFGVKRFGRHAWIRYSLLASAISSQPRSRRTRASCSPRALSSESMR